MKEEILTPYSAQDQDQEDITQEDEAIVVHDFGEDFGQLTRFENRSKVQFNILDPDDSRD